jgi:hypothetical protein
MVVGDEESVNMAVGWTDGSLPDEKLDLFWEI